MLKEIDDLRDYISISVFRIGGTVCIRLRKWIGYHFHLRSDMNTQ